MMERRKRLKKTKKRKFSARVLATMLIAILAIPTLGLKVMTSAGGENQNENMFMGELTYPDAVNGKTYRVTCVHYANYDVYEEVESDTGAFKFIL